MLVGSNIIIMYKVGQHNYVLLNVNKRISIYPISSGSLRQDPELYSIRQIERLRYPFPRPGRGGGGGGGGGGRVSFPLAW